MMRLQIPHSAYKNIVAGIIAIVCLVLLAAFPSRSVNPVWTGYRVLVVPLGENESAILSLLEGQKITGIASESNSRILNASSMSPVQPFLAEKNEALVPWFRNPERNIRYLYLPESPFLESRTDQAFANSEFSWNLEKADGFFPVPVFVLLALLALTVIFSRNRLFMMASGLPFALYIWSCNRYPAFALSVIFIYVFFLLVDLLDPGAPGITRQQRRERLLSHPAVCIAGLLACVFAVQAGLHLFFMLLASIALSFAAGVLVLSAREWIQTLAHGKRMHPAFRPNLMHPDSIKKKWPSRKTLTLLAPAPILVVSGIFLFGNAFPGASAAKKQESAQELYIPSPSGYTGHTGFDTDGYTELRTLREQPAYPDLAWFLSVRWNLETAPWRRVQDPVRDPETGETAGITQFKADENGMISGNEETMYTFNNSFIKKAFSGSVTPLEKMLLAQGRYAMVDLERHSR